MYRTLESHPIGRPSCKYSVGAGGENSLQFVPSSTITCCVREWRGERSKWKIPVLRTGLIQAMCNLFRHNEFPRPVSAWVVGVVDASCFAFCRLSSLIRHCVVVSYAIDYSRMSTGLKEFTVIFRLGRVDVPICWWQEILVRHRKQKKGHKLDRRTRWCSREKVWTKEIQIRYNGICMHESALCW